jgi:hypothetical protein
MAIEWETYRSIHIYYKRAPQQEIQTGFQI